MAMALGEPRTMAALDGCPLAQDLGPVDCGRGPPYGSDFSAVTREALRAWS